jgi:magnesium-transporting ATPase (P-type)
VRLERYGKNELTAEKPVPAWRKFLAQFQDVLVIAGMLKEAPTETTPLQKELDHVGWLLGIIR